GESAGGGPSSGPELENTMDWLDANGNGYFPYAWDSWSGLIESYANSNTPITANGVQYYDHINGITPPAPAQPTDGISFQPTSSSFCINLPSATMAFASSVSAGDDLFAVFAGQGYQAG